MQLNNSLPHIKILATGGTIAGSAAQAGQLTGYTAGALGIESLISAVPELESAAQVSGEQIANIDSCNITSGLWFKLAQRCNELMADNSVDGIVITHGTDTLEETAYFLNLTVKGTKPVVLTGAMRPATAISADGPLDLLNAVKTAACRDACGKGVLVVMNDIIMAARYATKTSAFKVEAFQAVPYGQLGTIAGGMVYFEAAINKCHTVNSVFAGKNYTSLPRTDIIYTHCMMTAYLLKQRKCRCAGHYLCRQRYGQYPLRCGGCTFKSRAARSCCCAQYPRKRRARSCR